MLEKFLPELSSSECAPLKEQLEQMIAARRLPHAIIIEGEDESLNASLARLIARARLCTCDEPLSGECETCRIVSTGTHPDIVEVEGSGKTGAISVDTVRQLHTYGSLSPEIADGIVYLLENGDLMLKPAQNAFLKLFEEPPENITFIITAASAAKLLETIRSRAFLLRATWPQKPEDSSDELRQQAEQLALSLLSGTEADTMLCTARYSRTGKDGAAARRELTLVLGELRAIIRQAMIINAGAPQVLSQISPAAERLAVNLPPARLEQLMVELPTIERSIKNNASMALVTSAMCVRLRKAVGK